MNSLRKLLNRYEKIGLTVAALMAFLLMAACARESKVNEPVTTTSDKGTSVAPPAEQVASRDAALVRVVNGIGNTDLVANNKDVFTDLPYKTVTPYKELPVAEYNFAIRSANNEQAAPLAQNKTSLGKGKHYTIVEMPASDKQEASMRVIADDITPPPTDKAKLRIINASPELKAVDIYMSNNNKALYKNLDFSEAPKYVYVNPMSGTLEVRDKGAKTGAILTIPDVKFEAGKIYTITIVGGSNTQPKLDAIMFEDQLGSAKTGV
jgi:hypothetical protein